MHEERIRAKAAAAYDRAFHPEGTARQTVAILASPDRAPALAKVEVPTLVIHGESDRLVDPSGGRATAAAIPGAELWTIPGMGHDLPPELFDQVADRVAALARNPTS
jgi:pimeloyl-ACP methyl ester carboxylesterase